MAGIKRTPADISFSNCIRERANWTCERCGKYYPEGHRNGLECSHHYSRRNWSIRLDPLNAEALCTGCHFLVGGTQDRRESVLTGDELCQLFIRKTDVKLAKVMRKTKGKGDIAKHFRKEFERMKELRANGVRGRIEFTGLNVM